MGKYIAVDSLWKCETCFYYQNNKCSPRVWCENGECYRPAYSKLIVINGDIIKNARWEICSDGYYPYCSNCKSEPKNGVMTKFCPSCGARMLGCENE